ncbi:MAG: homocysteine S-methyltransferase family protein [Planctomycetes bacterium]|nr:homocysteine S-methyltransferase family protein [Planctomycetota bacterium]
MADSRFIAALKERVILGDGATGTELLRRGCLPDHPLPELNLSRSHLVLDLHREYVEAGAELIRTNTFVANRLRLREQGLDGKVRDINLAGAKLAREAARGRFVAGSIGPLTDFRTEDRREAYREQGAALAEGGCELLLLETFQEILDLLDAILEVRKTGLPVVGQMAGGQLCLELNRGVQGLDVVGANCVSVEEALEAVVGLKDRAEQRSAFPSAGLPGKEIPPGEFAEGIRKLVEAGARLVGGCCGAGPAHIAAAAAVLGRGR